MYAARPVADRKKTISDTSPPLNWPFSETGRGAPTFFLFAYICALEQDLSNEGSIVLLDRVKAELQ